LGSTEEAAADEAAADEAAAEEAAAAAEEAAAEEAAAELTVWVDVDVPGLVVTIVQVCLQAVGR
jgi:hypothetical protein